MQHSVTHNNFIIKYNVWLFFRHSKFSLRYDRILLFLESHFLAIPFITLLPRWFVDIITAIRQSTTQSQEPLMVRERALCTTITKKTWGTNGIRPSMASLDGALCSFMQASGKMRVAICIFARLALYVSTRMFGSDFNSQNTHSHFRNSHLCNFNNDKLNRLTKLFSYFVKIANRLISTLRIMHNDKVTNYL